MLHKSLPPGVELFSAESLIGKFGISESALDPGILRVGVEIAPEGKHQLDKETHRPTVGETILCGSLDAESDDLPNAGFAANLAELSGKPFQVPHHFVLIAAEGILFKSCNVLRAESKHDLVCTILRG